MTLPIALVLGIALLATRDAVARTYSAYEQRTVDLALDRVGGEIDPEPEGKRIESVQIVRLDVVDERDPFPRFVNAFHATTREHIVERELLLRRGEHFHQRLSDETERNLRGLFLFSVVIAAPLRGHHPEAVRYLLVTKDLWSLRAGWDGRFANGVLDYLSVSPSETNLFGTGRQLSFQLSANPRTMGVGMGFVEPRLAGRVCASRPTCSPPSIALPDRPRATRAAFRTRARSFPRARAGPIPLPSPSARG